jgi:hypothetical protein
MRSFLCHGYATLYLEKKTGVHDPLFGASENLNLFAEFSGGRGYERRYRLRTAFHKQRGVVNPVRSSSMV